MNLSEKNIEKTINTPGILDTIENDLEELSLKLLYILKDCRDRELIGEIEYEKHTKIKKGFLNYLNEKRNMSTL